MAQIWTGENAFNWLGNNSPWASDMSLYGGSASLPFTNTKSISLGSTNSSKKIDFGNNFDFNNTSVFSISMWIKMPAASATGDFFAKYHSATNVGYEFYCNASRQVVFFMANNYPTNYLQLVSTLGVTAGWRNIIWTFDGTGTAAGSNLYVDSGNTALTVSSNTLGSGTTSVDSAFAGGETAAFFFNGSINNFSIWVGTKLTSGNATSIYNAGHAGDLSLLPFYSSCSSWYWMNENDTATTITDRKGSVNGTCISIVSGDFVTDVP